MFDVSILISTQGKENCFSSFHDDVRIPRGNTPNMFSVFSIELG